MTLQVRAFREGDRAAVIDLWSDAFPEEPHHNVSSEMIDMIDRKLRVQAELFLVAELDGVVVGAVMAGFDGVRGWLHRLAVRTGSRRNGVGTALVRSAESVLHALGCPKVNLQVRSSNAEVVAFYRAVGYAIEDRVSLGRRL
ncbi:MAG TPA: GNAT family acetyltransferase [Polyangiaceae bacterium]|nr:GNAT family acetyltransferase [Polyangiaceae bacterium]